MVVAAGGFLLVVVGFTCGWCGWAVLGYGSGGLCCVSVYGGVLLRFLDLKFVGGPVILVVAIVVVAVVVAVVLGSWLVVTVGTVFLYTIGF